MAGEPRFKRVRQHLLSSARRAGPEKTLRPSSLLSYMASRSSRDTALLLRQLKRDLELAIGASDVLRDGGDTQASLTDCSHCFGFMAHSLCLPCGHSMCKTCCAKSCTSCTSGAVVCATCKKTWPKTMPGTSGRERIPTIIAQTLFQKWFPLWVESAKHREEGNTFAGEGDYPLAVVSYDRALETGRY